MTGVELTRTIHTTHPTLPVILVTGDGDRGIYGILGKREYFASRIPRTN
jgi:hypothetical protein